MALWTVGGINMSTKSCPQLSRLKLEHDVFQAIADPSRRRLLKLLADKEKPIAAITECFPISRTAVNKHLHVLSDAFRR
jgi:DNA-binding transcriptional ArsR family regulator